MKRRESEDRLSQYMAALLSPEGWLFSVVTESEHAIGKRFGMLNEQNRMTNLEEDTVRRQFILLYQVCSNLIGASPYLAMGCQIYFWHTLTWTLPLLLAVGTQLIRLLLACNALADIPKEETEVPLQLRELSAFLKRPVQQDVMYPPSQPLQPHGDIVFDDVLFSYVEKGARIPILQNFNLTIQGGQRVGIVGRTGSGKTTLVKLLLRLYEVEEGSITIGGVDIREIPLETLRGWFGYCLQDPRMLPTFSIGENLGMARAGATLQEIQHAAKMACIDDTITQMDAGYDTPYRFGLSGGEKQRLGIALSHLRQSPIRIYDEFTSSVDAFTEEELIRGVQQVTKGGDTLIIIGHRLTTIANLTGGPNDLIVVLGEGGVILEQGTHGDLMRRRGKYFDLWKTQLGGVDLRMLYGK